MGLLKTQSSAYLGRGRARPAPGKSKVKYQVTLRNPTLMLLCGAGISELHSEDQACLAHGT